MPITVMENVVSNAERRAIQTGERDIVPRIADIYAALPAITGKIELEYEGELVGGHAIARELIRRAADATYQDRAGGINTDEIIMWFDVGGALQVTDDVPVETADRLMAGDRPDPILILCKAANFGWTTAKAIIMSRPSAKGTSNHSIDAAFANFEKLSASTAQRVVRFWQVSPPGDDV